MADEDTATKPEEPDELDRLVQARDWRFTKFQEIGYSDTEAWELAKGMVNFHYVEALIAHGCDLPTAARIAR